MRTVPRRARRSVRPLLRDWRAAIGLLAIAVAVVLAVRHGGDGAGRPAAERAAALVPDDALVYVHVSTDGARAPVGRLVELVRRLDAADAVAGTVGGLLAGGDGVDAAALERDVLPWLGDEAALALLPAGGTTAGSLLLLAVADEPAARRFVTRTAGPARRADDHHGVAVARHRRGVATAFVDGFLAVGQVRTVRAAVARARGRAAALADAAPYRAVRAHWPADRVLGGYATAAGVRRLLAPQRDALGLVGALLDRPGLRATGVAVTVAGTRATVHVHGTVDPAAHARTRAFAPTLTEVAPADAIAFAGFPSLREAGPALLAFGGAGAVGDGLGDLIAEAARVLERHDVDFATDVVPLLGREVAVTLVPGDAGGAAVLLGRVGDAERTRAAFRRIEPAIAALFAADSGDAPAFEDARAGGVPARRLVADGAQLAYAVRDGLVAVSPSVDAIAHVLGASTPIAKNRQFRAVIPDSPSELTAIVFLDFSQLLSLFEPLRPTDEGAAGVLQRVRAVGFASMSGEAHTTAELTFEIR